MVVLEVPMPSGFIIDKDKLAGLLRVPYIKLVETKRGETLANVYIDQMTAEEELCVTVQGYRSHQVAETKPVAVRIYDYYDSCKYRAFATPISHKFHHCKFIIRFLFLFISPSLLFLFYRPRREFFLSCCI